ncbi:hypothetical protein [Telmatospirillum sp.]|uniref:hypothetical protein n=1 Tax=Telmatospirillum sp. TaxID=2079197 RepID=UPI00284791C9|nr:hypothetical protein [Telmatospirillum sp.]MDR3437330.1 hypothetical protein [Telmatospirillum sp.]
MTRPVRRGFAARPASPDDWVKTAEAAPIPTSSADAVFTARLTIDITPALRGRIKIIAFQHGQTVADMLRALLAREFPDDTGDPT